MANSETSHLPFYRSATDRINHIRRNLSLPMSKEDYAAQSEIVGRLTYLFERYNLRDDNTPAYQAIFDRYWGGREYKDVAHIYHDLSIFEGHSKLPDSRVKEMYDGYIYEADWLKLIGIAHNAERRRYQKLLDARKVAETRNRSPRRENVEANANSGNRSPRRSPDPRARSPSPKDASSRRSYASVTRKNDR